MCAFSQVSEQEEQFEDVRVDICTCFGSGALDCAATVGREIPGMRASGMSLVQDCSGRSNQSKKSGGRALYLDGGPGI